MYSAASGWLMTSLNPDPLIVALVQAANTFPIFLLALPAGAFADIFDKRKYLIVVESLYTAISAVYAAIVWLGLATPGNLLVFTLLIGGAGALTAPAWQAVVPLLVAKDDLPAGIAANSVGINISRALGPALGGASISAFGIVAPFLANAIADIGIVGVAAMVAPAAKAEHAATGRAVWPRHLDRAKLRQTQSPFTRNAGAGDRIFSVRQRLLGLAAIGRSPAGRWWTEPLWHPFGCDRGRRRRRCVLPTVAESEAWARLGNGSRSARASADNGTLWHRQRASDGAVSQHYCGGVMDRGIGNAERVGTGCVTRLGSCAWACAIHGGVFRLPDAWQHGVGRGCRMGRIVGCPFHGRCRRGCRRTADVALETGDRRRSRSFTVHALADADHHAKYSARSRAGAGDGRV